MFTYKTNNRKVILFQFWNISLLPCKDRNPFTKISLCELGEGAIIFREGS